MRDATIGCGQNSLHGGCVRDTHLSHRLVRLDPTFLGLLYTAGEYTPLHGMYERLLRPLHVKPAAAISRSPWLRYLVVTSSHHRYVHRRFDETIAKY